MHISVLVNESLCFLNLKKGSIILDATIGCAGHAKNILEKITPGGKLIGIDCDKNVLAVAEESLQSFKNSYELVHSNFRNLDEALKKIGVEKINGALFDLGVSSFQLDNAERGFSFRNSARLDMRMNQRLNISAYDYINSASDFELSDTLRDYGEERYHKRIARAIVAARKLKPIETTTELADVIYKNTPGHYRKYKIDPATRTFQAIRIAVNDELRSLKGALGKIGDYLMPKARLVVISFNSLEDRIVKHNFKNMAKQNYYTVLTKKPVTPQESEISTNPRARSAKLRAIEKNG